MFDKESRDKYKSIKAPGNLREKVLTYSNKAEQEKTKYLKTLIRPLIGFAACLLILISVSILSVNNFGTMDIYVRDIKVEDEALVVSDRTRTALFTSNTSLSIPLEIKSGSPVKIDISSGILHVEGQDGSVLSVGVSVEVDDGQKIEWIVSNPDLSSSFILTLKARNKQYKYELFNDTNNGLWHIRLCEKGELK